MDGADAENQGFLQHVIDVSRDQAIQRESLADEISRIIPHFDAARYPDWSALLEAWIDKAPPQSTLVLGEFPYLARISPDLPGTVQQLLDINRDLPVNVILCGSSQRMMRGSIFSLGRYTQKLGARMRLQKY